MNNGINGSDQVIISNIMSLPGGQVLTLPALHTAYTSHQSPESSSTTLPWPGPSYITSPRTPHDTSHVSAVLITGVSVLTKSWLIGKSACYHLPFQQKVFKITWFYQIHQIIRHSNFYFVTSHCDPTAGVKQKIFSIFVLHPWTFNYQIFRDPANKVIDSVATICTVFN